MSGPSTTVSGPEPRPGMSPPGMAEISPGALARPRRALGDTWTITRRDLAHRAAQPWLVLVELLFPVMMVPMFGYLLGGAMEVPGGGDYREFLLPGLLAMTMLFGLEATFTAVSTDAANGVTDRFRSMPMAGSAVVAGRCVADLLNSVISLLIMVACGLAIGWRWRHGLDAALGAIGLLLLMRLAMLWVGIYLGLRLRGPESVMALQILVWPVGFLSGAFVSPATMPGWLGTIAEGNPLSATVTATRELFGNPGAGGRTWMAEHALPLAIVLPLALIVVFAPLSVRRYRSLA